MHVVSGMLRFCHQALKHEQYQVVVTLSELMRTLTAVTIKVLWLMPVTAGPIYPWLLVEVFPGWGNTRSKNYTLVYHNVIMCYL
jgi:hypothetical protein